MIVTGTAGERYPWEPITIAGLVERTARDHGDRDALVGDDRRLSWSQTRELSRGLAKSLIASGIGRGDHVALWMPNQIEWVALWCAASYVGAVLVTVNTRYKTEEVRYILRQSDARMLITVRAFIGIDYAAMLDELCPNLGSAPTPNAEDLPELRRVVVLGEPTPAGAVA
jgi:fatty-acyl-CoA synthase